MEIQLTAMSPGSCAPLARDFQYWVAKMGDIVLHLAENRSCRDSYSRKEKSIQKVETRSG